VSSLYLTYGTLVSPLGIGIEAHFNALSTQQSGLKVHEQSGFNNENWVLGKMSNLSGNRYDSLLKIALNDLKKKYHPTILSSEKTLFILSSTKANLEALPHDTFASTRSILKDLTSNPNAPVIISNACISGVMAINTAADYLKANKFEDAIIIGIDALFDFVVYGFQSLFALSDEAAKPFDKHRKGISIGEACGIVHLTKTKPQKFAVKYIGGTSSNDANHISGPSRTGEGLVRAIEKNLAQAKLRSSDIDFISAHGTGTLYNDEMESIAFSRTQLSAAPLNSLKGYFGHTLGAAGVIETIVSMLSMEHQLVFPSLGFDEQGTTEKLNIVKQLESAKIHTILKTASGFGGGNATIILQNIL